MTRGQVADWIAAYERAWRAPGTAALAGIFTEDAVYRQSPYTEPVKIGHGTLYRARFAGFASKNQARAACAYLSKRDFRCLAISD